ncbi:MAG: hypothetical protein ABI678_29150 [Kofleriaceae bacterium]
MKLAIVTVLALAGTAHADPARCARGLELAKSDLPRAALYLEGCTGAAEERAAAEVATKLRASELSTLTVTAGTEPVPFATDALPGEPLATPASIWVKAGTYKIRVVGTETEITATVAARSRSMLVLTAPAKPSVEPRQQVANFNDEPTDPPVVGPPPAQKHPSLLPCRYDGCETHDGEQLVDPLAAVEDRGPQHPATMRFGLRLGVASSGSLSPSVAAAARLSLPWDAFAVALRLDGSERGASDATYKELGLSAGLARMIAAPDVGWLSLAAAVRGQARAGAPMEVARAGIGATAELELALRRVPVTLGARYEQGLSELHDHAIVVELGVDWRLFN